MNEKLSWFDRFMLKLCVFKLFARTPDALYCAGALDSALRETASALALINEKESPLSEIRTPGEAQ